MSELITRRTFLKATGAAALAVAASGMLAGCGDGADALLSVSALPSVSSESYIFADTGYMIGLGSFEDCRSNSQREPGTNSTQHYYLYTAVSFQNVPNPFTLNASDFKFTFTNSSLTSKTSCSSLANYTLDSSTNKYKATTKRTISTGNSTIPLWVDLGSYLTFPPHILAALLSPTKTVLLSVTPAQATLLFLKPNKPNSRQMHLICREFFYLF